MYPVFMQIGPLSIHWYGVMMAVGFLAGLGNWWLLGRREGRDFSFCTDLMFWIMVSGLTGARIAYVLSDLEYFLVHPAEIIRVDQGGLVYYGGFVGAGLALWLLAWRRGLSLWALLDFVITAVPLAHAFGRIGCFLNGCCFGSVTHCTLHVVYPRTSVPWMEQVMAGLIGQHTEASLPIHPVQLYESVANLAVYAALVFAYRRKWRPGMVTALYLLIYPPLRFALELLRGDPRIRAAGLTLAQFVSIALFAVGLVLVSALRRRSVAT